MKNNLSFLSLAMQRYSAFPIWTIDFYYFFLWWYRFFLYNAFEAGTYIKSYKVNNINIECKFYGEQFLYIDKNLAIPYKKE